MGSVEVLCDAGISPASMLGPTSSELLPTLVLVGHIVIMIPALDYGYIEQTREGILNRRGNPSSTLVEILAIKRAKEISLEKELADYVILTDIQASFASTGVQEAKWLEPGRLNLPSLFLQRILDRAGYLRSSSRKVITRRPLDEVQKEVFRLFAAEKLEFELSKSALWNKIQSEISAAGRS